MEGERSLPCDTSSITKWFYREHLTVRSWHTSARLPNRKAYKGMPGIRFTNRFGSLQVSITGPVRLACMKAGGVVRFVQRQASHLHLKRAKLLTTALRSFLRYARYRGQVTLDLAAAVPAVANWSMPSIPRAIGADQVRQLLAKVDRRTPMGRRDY